MITIGFSPHHVEALPFIREQMGRHQVIVLEEPPAADFQSMLRGDISIDQYMMELDPGFPEFDRQLCQVLRNLHGEGRRITQVEPYLERLLQIHERFAAGQSSDDVMRIPALREVYAAERTATAALITYYTRSMEAPFDGVVEAVKNFARADAQRLTLRERLRAKVIVSLLRPKDTLYIEAGYIHYPLHNYLRAELGNRQKIRVVFLLGPLVKKLGGKRRNLGPGDILTLHYAFHQGLKEEQANVLAARSLIYIKLIHKEELLPGEAEAPHTQDMVEANNLVERLEFSQCGDLFDQIRMASRERAVQLVQAYVSQTD